MRAAAAALTKSDTYHKKSFYWLRNRFVNESNVAPRHRFLLDTPKHVREGAVKDLAQAYAVNFKLRRTKPGHTFFIRFRKRKEAQSIVIPKTAFKMTGDNKATFYPKMLAEEGFVDLRELPTADCRLSVDRLGRWILYVPVDVETFAPTDNQGGAACSIDPGVRTFLTTWSPDGRAFKLGDNDSARMYAMLLRIDKLVAAVAKATKRSKWRKRRALNRLRQRYENVQRDLHYQCANFVVTKYDVVLLPTFGSKRMSSRMDRKLHTKTVRSMLGMGHYAFRQRLKEVAERRGVVVREAPEDYTSKTCSVCGWLHPSLGGSKAFRCRDCGAVVDRDLQGAFNIYLKYAKEHPGFYVPGGAPHACA